MSVKNHDAVASATPAMLHPRNRLEVVVNSTIAPETRVPAGWAAIDKAIVTEFTLPCMSRGTIICIIVCNKTLATGRDTAKTSALRAMNQKDPVGVNAISAYPEKAITIATTVVRIFFSNPFFTDISRPPHRIPP